MGREEDEEEACGEDRAEQSEMPESRRSGSSIGGGFSEAERGSHWAHVPMLIVEMGMVSV